MSWSWSHTESAATPLSLSSALVLGAKPSSIGVMLSMAFSVAGDGNGCDESKMALLGVELAESDNGDMGWSSLRCTRAGNPLEAWSEPEAEAPTMGMGLDGGLLLGMGGVE